MRFVRTVCFLGLILDAAWVPAQGLFTFPNGRRPGNVDQVTAQLKVGGVFSKCEPERWNE